MRMRWSSHSSSNNSIDANAAAHAIGLAVNECPWKNVLVRSSLRNASYIASVAAVAASGKTPPVSPLDRHRRSGDTSARSQANSGPVRPNPVRTSSAMRCTPASRVRSRRVRSTCSSHTRMPPAPSNNGSTITAANSDPRACNSASRAATVSPSDGSGSRTTSKRSGSYICVNTPRAPTAIAPNVSP